jgi:putative acetyltransferase
MSESFVIRAETPADHAIIADVIETAFGQADEARLVDQLREDGDLALSLVYEEHGRICGHIALSLMSAHADGSDCSAWGLAPISVLPEYQRRGIGAALINDALAKAALSGIQMIFLFGDPVFYGKFGFSVDNAKGFASPYAGPYWQVNILDDGLQMPLIGKAQYARAFKVLG